jgi:ATP phosphoribosyltransferase regulatory subunit
MKTWKQQLPTGVQDFLPDECYNKRIIENKIRSLFSLSGYDEIETPVLEYFDVFTEGKASIEQEQMFKLSEMGGRILVLRPDITMPIARIAATKLKDKLLPLRLFYISNVFRYGEPQFGWQREVPQAGIELLGAEGPDADAEVIATAVQTLLDLGLTEFQIDIGQVEFFKGLLEEAGLTDEQSEKLRFLIDHKNILALEIFLDELNLSHDIKTIFLSLPNMYGNGDMLESALGFSQNERCRAALVNIKQVYSVLKDYDLNRYISIDLGMVQSLNYYTGIIFRGITKEIGYPICGGGRYDKLVSEFGRNLPATGFALGIKRVLIALERQQRLEQIPPVDVLFVMENTYLAECYRMIQSLRNQGLRVECFLESSTENDPIAYAKKKGIKKVGTIKGFQSI